MLKLRPDGKIEISGSTSEDALLSILKDTTASGDAALDWLRNLVADHVRRVVAASDDGSMPTDAVC